MSAAQAFIVVTVAAGAGQLMVRGALDVYRMLRHGPALYRSSRKLGGSRLHALKIVVWP